MFLGINISALGRKWPKLTREEKIQQLDHYQGIYRLVIPRLISSDLKDNTGATTLRRATLSGDIAMIKVLINAEADAASIVSKLVAGAPDAATQVALLKKAIAVDEQNEPVHALSAYLRSKGEILALIQSEINKLESSATQSLAMNKSFIAGSSSVASGSGSNPDVDNQLKNK